MQVSVLSAYTPLGGSADLVLVTLVSIALLRGSVFGAAAGFGAGLLLDIAHLETLGFTSLLLTVAGFWIGRYGETTARDRFHAPYVSVAVVTVLLAFGRSRCASSSASRRRQGSRSRRCRPASS